MSKKDEDIDDILEELGLSDDEREIKDHNDSFSVDTTADDDDDDDWDDDDWDDDDDDDDLTEEDSPDWDDGDQPEFSDGPECDGWEERCGKPARDDNGLDFHVI